jgi:hypothetical protein
MRFIVQAFPGWDVMPLTQGSRVNLRQFFSGCQQIRVRASGLSAGGHYFDLLNQPVPRVLFDKNAAEY